MESQNSRSDNGPAIMDSGEELHTPRAHTESTEVNDIKLVPVPYNISSQLPTYEEATANTYLPANYAQIHSNRSNGVYGIRQQSSLQQSNSSAFPDSSFPQEWYALLKS